MIDTYSMYIIASLFFIAGIAAGAAYGFMVEKSAMDMVIFIVAGGFAGSAAGGLVFTYLYFTGQNEDEKNINEQDTFQDIPTKPGSIISRESKAAGANQKKKETDRQKIKRLRKEISKLKKTKNRKQAY